MFISLIKPIYILQKKRVEKVVWFHHKQEIDICSRAHSKTPTRKQNDSIGFSRRLWSRHCECCSVFLEFTERNRKKIQNCWSEKKRKKTKLKCTQRSEVKRRKPSGMTAFRKFHFFSVVSMLWMRIQTMNRFIRWNEWLSSRIIKKNIKRKT